MSYTGTTPDQPNQPVQQPQPVDYKVVLADLKRKRDDLDKAIAGIETILGLSVSVAISGVAATAEVGTAEVKSDSFFGMSIVQAAQKYLGMMKKPMGTPEISEALAKGGLLNQSENFGNTVGSVLARNAENENGTICRVSRGTWGLRAWYPNFRFKAKNGKEAEEDLGNNNFNDL